MLLWSVLLLCLIVFGLSCLILALWATPAALVSAVAAFGVGWWASGEIEGS